MLVFFFLKSCKVNDVFVILRNESKLTGNELTKPYLCHPFPHGTGGMRGEWIHPCGDSLVYFKGSPYTGEVWSTDSLWCLTVEDGRMTAFKLYHANGGAAFTMASPADTLQAFDETGTAMSIDSFAVKYKDIADEIPALINRIHGDLTEP